jgi:DNA-directed RNA polymerase subunit alpha
VLEMLGRGEEAMLTIRNFGQKSLAELREKLIAKNFLKEADMPPVTITEDDGDSEREE